MVNTFQGRNLDRDAGSGYMQVIPVYVQLVLKRFYGQGRTC